MEHDRRQWAEALLARYEGPLIRYATSILGDRDAARDAAQEAFVRLMREPDCREPEPWLFRVCRNCALDAVRKQRRIVPMDEALLSRQAGTGPEPAAALESRESAEELLALVADLPANQREVIRLRFQQSFSYREISEITDLTVSNVGVLLHTGLRTLRARLSRETPSEKQRKLS